MAKIIVTTGKGGVGKTTLLALLLSASLPHLQEKSVLLIDGDPDQTLGESLCLPEPPATIADVRDERITVNTLRNSGQTMAEYVKASMQKQGVITTANLSRYSFDYMVMGRSKEQGCYCGVNTALANIFQELQLNYDYIFVDSPAGTEHLSRYRLHRADWFIIVQTTSHASQQVRQRILETIQVVGMDVTYVVDVVNLCESASLFEPKLNGTNGSKLWVPYSQGVKTLADSGESVNLLTERHDPITQAISPLVNWITHPS